MKRLFVKKQSLTELLAIWLLLLTLWSNTDWLFHLTVLQHTVLGISNIYFVLTLLSSSDLNKKYSSLYRVWYIWALIINCDVFLRKHESIVKYTNSYRDTWTSQNRSLKDSVPIWYSYWLLNLETKGGQEAWQRWGGGKNRIRPFSTVALLYLFFFHILDFQMQHKKNQESTLDRHFSV